MASLRPLASSRTHEPCQRVKYLVVQLLWVTTTPEDGVCAHIAHPSDNPDDPEASLVTSANQTVHMDLSLYLSFQLSHNLWGYTVGTTMGFRVPTMEAPAQWPHHRIP
jgi:hypothetical protein